MDEKNRIFHDFLIERKVLPSEGQFLITDEILEKSFLLYRELFGAKKSTYKRGDKRLAKKIAFLNLQKLNDERGNEVSNDITQKGGFLYIISNSAYPNCFKIGITKSIKSRLSTYQTSDPYRRYKVEHYFFVEDRRVSEKDLMNEFNKRGKLLGEWIKDTSAKEIFNVIINRPNEKKIKKIKKKNRRRNRVKYEHKFPYNTGVGVRHERDL